MPDELERALNTIMQPGFGKTETPPSAGASGGVTDAIAKLKHALSVGAGCVSECGGRCTACPEELIQDAIRDFSHAPVASPAVRNDVIEECAKVVDEGQESQRNNMKGTEFYVSRRSHGNLTGLSFAAAIRALKSTNQEGGG